MTRISEEKAEYIAESLSEQEYSFEYKNPIKQVGFAQIEHILSFDNTLSDGAYRTYAVILSFAQQHNWATPAVDTLSKLRGKDEATISRHINELQEREIIDRKRRVGTSSKTYILDLPSEYEESAKLILQKRDIAKMQRRTSQKCNDEPRKNAMKRITIEEEQVKNCIPKSEIPSPLAGKSGEIDFPAGKKETKRTEGEIKRDIASAVGGFVTGKKSVSDVRAAEKDVVDHVAASLLRVFVQEDVPINKVTSSLRNAAKNVARGKATDIVNGVTTLERFDEAVAHFANGGFSSIENEFNKAEEKKKLYGGFWVILNAIDAYLSESHEKVLRVGGGFYA